MGQRYVLLFGLPRSGTTWLGKIFDSHPRTIYRHEPDSVDRIGQLPLLIDDLAPEDEEILRKYCREIPRNRALKVVGKSPVFPKDYLSPGALVKYRLGIHASQVASRLNLAIPVMGVPKSAGKECAIVWKSIESLGRLGALLQVLPQAKAIHIVRHPCGFVASVERGEANSRFYDNSGASEDYGILEMLLRTRVGQSWGFSIADLRAMYPEERLAWRWAVFNDKALEDTQPVTNARTLAYEELCEAPMDMTRKLMGFADLGWSPQVERFVRASTTGMGESAYYSVFKNPKLAAWSWQKQLTSARAERIVDIAARSRTWKQLGYQDASGG